MDIRPIKTKIDYETAMSRLEQIWDPEPDTPEGDEFEVLPMLIEAYEDKHYPIDPPDPIEAILFRMEQQELTRKDLEPYTGSRARVSEGQREGQVSYPRFINTTFTRSKY